MFSINNLNDNVYFPGIVLNTETYLKFDTWILQNQDSRWEEIVPWPTPDEYSDAVQCPELSFEDDDLAAAEVELTPMGLPKVASGNFACVYRMNSGGKSYAVKCFMRSVHNQHTRYNALSQFVMTTHLEPLVNFEYMLKGIHIDGNWYPIVKMDWVDGLTLDQFFRKNWSNKPEIDRVLRQFSHLIQGLKETGVAHCDLQHGNILVKGDSIMLVDYDGMFVPAMAGQSSNELGHGNYQHPERRENHFGPSLDDFSAWIIYYSLFLLKLDSSLWQRYAGGEDCLLFRKKDFQAPLDSRLLAELAASRIPEMQALHKQIMTLITNRIEECPTFEIVPPETSTTSNITTSSAHLPSISKRNIETPQYPAIWPRMEQYFSSIIRPSKNFSDEKLSSSVPVPTAGRTSHEAEVDATTQERVSIDSTIIKGSRHIVTRLALSDGSKQYAVKLFTKPMADRHLRFDAIHRYKKETAGPYFVPFVYQPKGILVGEHWFPVLKMLWIKGVTLDAYVSEQLAKGNHDAIEELLPKFEKMLKALVADGIAHGDLEPRNIIVDETGNLRLVDYDCMYIPSLASLTGCEVGHADYQHPSRRAQHFGLYLDNYSSILIYGILRCLSCHAPSKFWSFKAIIKELSGQFSQDGATLAKNKAPGWLLDKTGTPGLQKAGRLDPVFDKATLIEASASNFDTAKLRLSKLLKEERLRRIDQVNTLANVLWRLY